MKILQIINSLGTGGAEKLLLDTIPLYHKAGIEMDILLLWDNDFPFTKKLKELNCCNIYILKQSNNFKDIYSLSHILRIRKIIKEYDIAHVHLFPAQYFVAVANMGVGKKMIFTEHNTTNNRIKNKKYKLIEKGCYAQYNKLTCISNEIFDIYNQYLGIGNKSVVIQNGVDLDKIKNAYPYGKMDIDKSIEETDILLLQVSAFRIQKDQDSLIKALYNLPKHYKLLLVGDGERRPELEQLVKKLHLDNRVYFLGQRMDVAELLKSVDIVVLASHFEGLSLASVEGLASGKPFIASDVPGLHEVVKDAGILFKDGDEKELSDIILKLGKDPSFAKETAQKGEKRSKEYDIKKMVKKHIEMYKSIYEA